MELLKEIRLQERLQRKVVKNNWKEFKRNSPGRFKDEQYKLIKLFLGSDIPQFNISFKVIS